MRSILLYSIIFFLQPIIGVIYDIVLVHVLGTFYALPSSIYVVMHICLHLPSS